MWGGRVFLLHRGQQICDRHRAAGRRRKLNRVLGLHAHAMLEEFIYKAVVLGGRNEEIAGEAGFSLSQYLLGAGPSDSGQYYWKVHIWICRERGRS